VRLKIVTGKDGEVSLPDREAAAAGLEGAAEWRALPGLGLLSQGELAGAWFAGALAAASLAEVAQLVASTLKTGVLHLSLAGGAGTRQRKAIHVRDGTVVFASSSDPADRLGPVLERLGLAPAEALAACAPLVGPGRPLGQLLVERGTLSAGQLYEGIAAQVREIFLSAFEAPEGEFLFREAPLDERNAVRLPERTRDLILAGLKRAEGAERRAGGGAAAPPAAPLSPGAAASAVPGGRGPAAGAPSPPPAGGPFETYRRLLRAVYGPLARASPDAARRLDSWFERGPGPQRAFFEGVRFGASGELDVERVLANVSAEGWQAAAARAKALEALESLLTFALFEAQNLLPRDQGEALRRQVRQIQLGG
jgi:hypothetical protein